MTLQNPAFPPAHASPSAAESPAAHEGARYALLQRLTPALQHQIMGSFQSMDMIAAMMERRLQSDAPDLASMREDCALLGSVSQSAVQSIIHFMGWVRHGAESLFRFDAGVAECTKVLLAELQFRGFAIVNEVEPSEAMVSSRALRSVLSAALTALSDLSPAPARLLMRAQVLPARVELSIDRTPTGQPATRAASPSYRLLKWQDVEALAAAESVELALSDTGARLSFERPADCAGLPASFR